MHRVSPVVPCLVIPVLLLLPAACGGGGGGGGGPVTTVTPPGTPTLRPPIAWDTAEYRASTGLARIRAGEAYGRGITGAGTTVAVIDSGIKADSVEFSGALHPASTDVVAARNGQALTDVDGHGTAVASVAGARRNDWNTHGVAFGATILAVRADTSGLYYDGDLATATRHATVNGAGVVNYSLGGGGPGPGLAAALADAASAGAVLVVAAGNSAAANPSAFAQWFASAQAAGTGIVVGSVDAGDVISAFSNRAGTAAARYLVAPGENVPALDRNGAPANWSGTSFATPHIAGAAALLREAFPHLTAAQIADLLLRTARDLGAPGTDPVYGRGMLDVGAAVAPVGATVVPMGTTVDGPSADVTRTAVVAGAALGDALVRTPALSDVVMLDEYDRAYRVDLTPGIARSAAGPDLAGWISGDRRMQVSGSETPHGSLSLATEQTPAHGPLRDPADGPGRQSASFTTTIGASTVTLGSGTAIGPRFGLAASIPAEALLAPEGLSSPWLALTDGGDGVTVLSPLGTGASLRFGVLRTGATEERRGSGGASAHEGRTAWIAELGVPLGPVHAGLQVGGLEERGSILDTSGSSALAMGGTRVATRFAGLHAEIPVGDAALFGGWQAGVTGATRLGDGLMRGISDLRSSSWTLGASLDGPFGAGGRLTATASRPLRVTAGTASLDVPVGRTPWGEVLRERRDISLVPSGEQTDLQLGWRRPLKGGAALDAGAVLSLEPGHVEDAAPEAAIGIRWHMPL